MGTTTFSGPVNSQNGFQTITVNASTGAVTVTGTVGAAVTATSTITALSGSALTAGGAAAFVGTNTSGSMGVYFGSGAPTVSAAKGSLYLRSDGSSTSTRAYINTDGATTWTAITTAA
jgi:hypothetical protein